MKMDRMNNNKYQLLELDVGSTTPTIMLSGLVSELVLVDISREKQMVK